MITTKYQKHQIHSEPLILWCLLSTFNIAPKLLQKMGEIFVKFLFRKQIGGGAASMAPSGRKLLKSNRKV